jgi:LysM repeat protein
LKATFLLTRGGDGYIYKTRLLSRGSTFDLQDTQRRKPLMQRKWSPVSVCVIVIMGLSFIFTGCATKQPVQALSVDKAPAAEQEVIAQKQSTAEKADVKPAGDKPSPRDQGAADNKIKPAASATDTRALPATYVVKEGDSLWWIAQFKDVYNDPYLWPVLYDANKNVIKDQNKIYPGMKLQIPRTGYKPIDIRNARKTAGACNPYNPPARAVPPAD